MPRNDVTQSPEKSSIKLLCIMCYFSTFFSYQFPTVININEVIVRGTRGLLTLFGTIKTKATEGGN